MMKTALFVFLLSFAGIASLHAQPIIQLSDVTPDFGLNLEVVDASYVDPGDPGANQTWDLSAMESEMLIEISYTAPEGQPMAGNFPNATHCMVNFVEGLPYYQYWSYADNQAEEHGAYVDGPGVEFEQQYSDPRARIQFPIEFNSTFTDEYDYQLTSTISLGEEAFVSNLNETGSYSAEVDGYGTLITPAGTFEDVLRIKYITTFSQESYSGKDLEFMADGAEIEYVFLKAGIPFPLATLLESQLTMDGEEMEPDFTGSYYNGSAVDIVESESFKAEVTLFPVPAQESVNVRLLLDEPLEIGFALFSADGKSIREWNSQLLVAGEHQLRFDLPDLPVGKYLLRLSDGQRQIVRPLVVGK